MAEGFITRRGGVAGEVAPEYITATGGTTTEYNENGKRYKSHTFTTSGTFTVTSLGNGDRNLVDYLIVAGGGGGGGAANNVSLGGGGGGAGGFLHSISHSGALSQKLNKFEVSQTSYGVTIGAGGNGGNNSQGINGNNSSIFNLTSISGGGGGRWGSDGNAGGSGGGGGGFNVGSGRQGGNGTANQGTRGCNSPSIDPARRVGGGGGGAAFTNQDFLTYYTNLALNGRHGIPGGEGLPSSIVNGNPLFYAGGGGGGAASGQSGDSSIGGLGGRGGGGRGADNPNGNAESGSTNTGGGGGGGTRGKPTGGNGGSGIVIIRYEVEAV